MDVREAIKIAYQAKILRYFIKAGKQVIQFIKDEMRMSDAGQRGKSLNEKNKTCIYDLLIKILCVVKQSVIKILERHIVYFPFKFKRSSHMQYHMKVQEICYKKMVLHTIMEST